MNQKCGLLEIFGGRETLQIHDRRDAGALRIGPFRINSEPLDLLAAIYDCGLKLGDGNQVLERMALGTADLDDNGMPGPSGLKINWLGSDVYEITAANPFVHGALLSAEDGLPSEDLHPFLRKIANFIIPGMPLVLDGRRYVEGRLISTVTTISIDTVNGRDVIKADIEKSMLEYATCETSGLTSRSYIYGLPYTIHATANPDNVVQFQRQPLAATG